MQAMQNDIVKKFRDAENMWFWFVSSAKLRDAIRAKRESNFRPCELIDIETLVTRLYLSGRITREQLEVMQEFGMRRRPPHQHIYAENAKAALWSAAMRTLQLAASGKGWVE